MKIRRYYVLAVWLLIWGATAFFPISGTAAVSEKKPVLILTDVSGTMQEKVEIQHPKTKKTDEISKSQALKELLVNISRELPAMTCETGIYQVRYLSGDRNRYEVFLKIASYKQEEMTGAVEKDFPTDYPVFNRRTPLADMLRQLDDEEISNLNGEITLVLISDGRETFYNLKKDEEESKKEDIKQDDKVKGPLTEITRMKKKYGDKLVLHTIFLDQKAKEDDKESNNEKLLKNIASAGEGKYFSGVQLLEDHAILADFCALLCPKEPVETVQDVPKAVPEVIIAQPAVEPPPEPEKKEPEAPVDTDGDGVYDPDDQCPGTPEGAKVNKFGCWTLPGVLFAFDKWDIRPQFFSELDDAVTVLKNNPDLKIVVEGHTDGKGTAAYNEKLSERRANSVMEYFKKKGIQKERLSAKGYGLTKPVATNATAEGRTLNRRVELKPVD